MSHAVVWLLVIGGLNVKILNVLFFRKLRNMEEGADKKEAKKAKTSR